MKKIAILGSTGSIGTQGLDIARRNPDKFEITALTCNTSIDKIREQLKEFHPSMAAVAREEDAKLLREEFQDIEILSGQEGIISCATSDCDMVLNSLLGISGLVPTVHAAKAGKDIAFANKETLVTGGELVMGLVKKHGVNMLPVDSEHSAIFQCLEGNRHNKVRRILLTCSGGPFRGFTREQLEQVTLAQALKHPNWSMGQKITIDSATMMNKGFEVIEAKWLFDVEAEDIEVLVHPQSIMHSAVEFCDTSVIAQMGLPDMRVPISLAFTYPERIDSGLESLEFTKLSGMTFEKPDLETFECLGLAYEALREGGSFPVVLNGANEVLVAEFLKGRIRFIDIQNTLKSILEKHTVKRNLELEEILEADRWARDAVYESLKGLE